MNNTTTSPWYVYMLRCADNSLYTGVTTSLERRVKEHNTKGKAAAKYTRIRQPVELVYYESAQDRASASKREYQIKQLSKLKKEQLISKYKAS